MIRQHRQAILCMAIIAMLLSVTAFAVEGYKNFDVAIYVRAQETKEMGDINWLQPKWDIISSQLHVDKIYLETHRDQLLVDKETMLKAKQFFESKGVKTAGGITLTMNERNRFQTFCYTNPEHRKKVQEIVELTASIFDELILDDFFFTNCKCDLCVKAKGKKSWTDYRLELMQKAAEDLIVKPAKKVNPQIKVVIKYPNWYEHFQGLGFNLETQPHTFDGVYTGTETRDPSSDQHLQAYESYLIIRYFDNLRPGHNYGGWVDTGGSRYLDRYAEQLWLTLLAKAPEITLFEFRAATMEVRDTQRGEWQGQGTTFDFDAMKKPFTLPDGTTSTKTTIAGAAAYSFEQVDKVLGELGKPVGLKSYKPYHSVGEDFLQNYFGMIGIPMDIVPEFPVAEKMILLTESAAFDPDIVKKIKGQLAAGKNVTITSGLLKALQGKGIEDIAEIRYTDRKALVKDFRAGWGQFVQSPVEILIPQIMYLTNDSWEEVSGFDGTNGWPMLHSAAYSNGKLFVLTVPESFTDLYNLPVEVLSRFSETLLQNMYVRINAPGYVSLFVYDNNTFIIESFRDTAVDVNIILDSAMKSLRTLDDNQPLTGEDVRGWFGAPVTKKSYKTTIKPHSFRVFRCE
ncbi:MAG TPA: hypothetical protein PLP19_11260 [bacterium]|nr:hypothetical protein [bacterium]HPN44060.1 hypothetical protein [bacterium]